MRKLYIEKTENATEIFVIWLGKFTARSGNFPLSIRKFTSRTLKIVIRKGISIFMYRLRLLEIKKEKNLSTKKWSEESGVSIDTINRITNPENPTKDSPRVNTLEDLCKPLGVELWEIFYMGDKSLVSLQAEIALLKAEHDALIAENGALKDKVETLRDKVDTLKDEIIATHKYYNKLNSND